jgi:GNAT superfamily N-acetyltransferase
VASDQAAVFPLAVALATSYVPVEEDFEASFVDILADPRATVLVAEESREIVGYVHALVHPAFHANGLIAWVEEVVVSADRRGSGCGAALMRAAEEWAQHQGAAYLSLATRRASGFYGSLGYEESAIYFKKSFR